MEKVMEDEKRAKLERKQEEEPDPLKEPGILSV